jgi:hypothetical protein
MAIKNKTINDGSYGSYMADPGQAAIGIYIRCKFVDSAGATKDGSPYLQVAGVAERADVITMQPIAAGAYGTVKFANSPGEQFGIASGAIALAAAVNGAALGKVASGGAGALIGKATSIAVDGKPFTYLPVPGPIPV